MHREIVISSKKHAVVLQECSEDSVPMSGRITQMSGLLGNLQTGAMILVEKKAVLCAIS